MRAATRGAFEFVERCQGHTKPQALFDDFATVIAAFGFENFIMSGLPARDENVEDLVICNRWPIAWTDRYRSESYFVADPISQMASSSSVPFLWREARARRPATSASLVIEAEAKDFGLADGVSLPMFDAKSWQAVASLASCAPCDLAPSDISLVYLASLSCQMRATDLAGPAPWLQPTLTTREAEVLTWIAAGKSYWEVSTILGIAETTVHSHLVSVRRKLNVTNTVQAVARAARTRQIRI